MLRLPNEPQYATMLNRTLRFKVACCGCLYEPQYATVKQNIAFYFRVAYFLLRRRRYQTEYSVLASHVAFTRCTENGNLGGALRDPYTEQ